MYNSRNIDDLRPDVAANCKIFLERCNAAGLKVLVTGTVRDKEFQLDCYKRGTSKAKVPTFHAKGVGLAFDICQNIKGKEYSDMFFFKNCAAIGKEIGFEWGGDWKSIVDMPHFQWAGNKKEYTSKDILKGKYPPPMPLKQGDGSLVCQKQPQKPYINYTVVKGDSYYKISKKFGISWGKIMKDNNTLNPLLKIGQIIKIYK